MLDGTNALQQEALGIVGVKLLHGAFFLYAEPELLIESLLDGLTTERIAIDMIEFSGIEFRQVDNRLMSMKLVQMGLSGAAMFDPSGRVLQPSEVLHRKNVLVERGSFRPVCHVNIDMMRCAREAFERELSGPRAADEPGSADGDIVELMELTMRNLREQGGDIDREDFLARADMLAASGKTVLISDYFEYYRLAAYIGQYTKKRVATVTMGAASLLELFDEKYYAELDGGILESFGRLFKHDLRLYIYPLLDQATGKLTTVENLEVAPALRKLYGYLVDRGHILQLENVNPEYLRYFSRDALDKIRRGDHSWEEDGPAPRSPSSSSAASSSATASRTSAEQTIRVATEGRSQGRGDGRGADRA